MNSTPVPSRPAPASLPNPMPQPATPPSSENFDTPEYRNSSAAVGSNAIGAWQHGASGRGITIGFVDTGIVPSLSDFDGRIHPSSDDVNGDRPMDDIWGHGTALAGIAAAARDNDGMQGIAFDATIFMAKADQGCPEHCVFPEPAVARGIDEARLAGARVINLSMNGDNDGAIFDAAQRAINAGIIIVVAAGNSGSSPSDLATRLASMAPGQVIVVGGLGVSNADGTINYDVPSIYTTGAGSTQASFLAAPGWLNSATYFRGGGIDRLSGTSFAAPVVAGAVALLAQAFPMLTPQQIVLLLFMTSDDLGLSGTDSTFGRGRLNIGRAFQPVGSTRLANNLTPVPKSIGRLPLAAGDAARRGDLKATVLDDFNRPFDLDLAATMLELSEAGLLARTLVVGQRNQSASIGSVALAFTVDGLGARPLAMEKPGRPEFENSPARLLAVSATVRLLKSSSLAIGYGIGSPNLRSQIAGASRNDFLLADRAIARLGFTPRERASAVFEHKMGRWGVSIAAERGALPTYGQQRTEAGYSLASISIDRRGGTGHLRLSMTRLAERSSILGGQVSEIFSQPGAGTWFGDVEMVWQFNQGWLLGGASRHGWTSFSNGSFSTSAFSLDVTKNGVFRQDDTIALRISQPLRVEKGGIGIILPTSWDYLTKEAGEARQRMALTPSGREITAELGYLRTLKSGSLSFHLYHRRDAGHVRGAGDVGAAIRSNIRL